MRLFKTKWRIVETVYDEQYGQVISHRYWVEFRILGLWERWDTSFDSLYDAKEALYKRIRSNEVKVVYTCES